MVTVSVPPLKSTESGSVTVAMSSTATAPSPSLYSSAVLWSVIIGASLPAVKLIFLAAGELLPPSPSVREKLTIRVTMEGESDALLKTMDLTSAWTATGVAALFRLTTSAVEPVIGPP